MAHFAELDENNVVKRVIVISNQDISDINGVESEEIGIAYCKKVYGVETKWKQTSFNSNIRNRYAGIGCFYDEESDNFIDPQPFPSWSLNRETLSWDPPVPVGDPQELSEGEGYFWDENLYQQDSTKGWVVKTFEQFSNEMNELARLEELRMMEEMKSNNSSENSQLIEEYPLETRESETEE